ncbi:MAG: hypothetical protein AB1758_03150 [Candidatus Eremiobacterota bacterium]
MVFFGGLVAWPVWYYRMADAARLFLAEGCPYMLPLVAVGVAMGGRRTTLGKLALALVLLFILGGFLPIL